MARRVAVRHRLRRAIGVGIIMLGLASLHAAHGFDLQAFWENRCKDCHGSVEAFARQRLSVVDGRLQGRHHVENLKRFMGQHEMGPEHVEGIYAMQLAQVSTGTVYQQKCAGCHKTEAEFARESLVMKDGVVTGRMTGRPVAEFLKRHGKLSAEEQPAVIEMLTRALSAAGAGAPTK